MSIYTGTFKSKQGVQYNITIGDTGNSVTIKDTTDLTGGIAADTSYVMFAQDPITVSCDRGDLTNRIIISTATINLVTNMNMIDLQASHVNEIPVLITSGDDTVFSGFIDPLQFNQGYAHYWEDFSITATDPLAGLEYMKVNQIKDNQNNYITSSTQVVSRDLIDYILSAIGLTTDDTTLNTIVKDALEGTKIQMSVFFGDNPDDYKTLKEVLEEICKYYNLYIIMKDEDTVSIYTSVNQSLTNVAISGPQSSININQYVIADDSTNISQDEAYASVKLTCEIEPVSDLIVSPTNNDNLRSVFDAPDLYMTEYVSEGATSVAMDAFVKMLNGQTTTYDKSWSKHHYVYALQNDAWNFGDSSSSDNYLNYLSSGSQIGLLGWLAAKRWRCALVGFGSGDKIKYNDQASYTQGYLNLDKYLIISCNGGWDNPSDAAAFSSSIEAAQPLCKYTGIETSVLSPSDANVKNYIIISGSIILNPLIRKSGSEKNSSTTQQKYDMTYNNTWSNAVTTFNSYETKYMKGSFGNNIPYKQNAGWLHTVPYVNSADYYQQHWVSETLGCGDFLNVEKQKLWQYKYSSFGNSNDTIKKLPIIACRLRVGEPGEWIIDENNQRVWDDKGAKYCVEKIQGTRFGSHQPNTFAWVTQAETEDPQSPYYGWQLYFTLGIDPQIDTYLIGSGASNISNKIDYKVNVDATGTAIPVTFEDGLSGPVTFEILGPYNTTWKNITKSTHGYYVFWSHVIWNEESLSVLNNIESIMIKDLKIGIKNDNGGKNPLATTADNDLVYASQTNATYTDDLEADLMISTPLTLQECTDWGVKYVSNGKSWIYNTDNTPFAGFQGTGAAVKPEECFVDYLYQEYNRPMNIIETSVMNDKLFSGDAQYGIKLNGDMLSKTISGIVLNGKYQLMSYVSNLQNGTTDVKLRGVQAVNNQQVS